MWTDGRYYIAAVKQLEPGWEMMKMEAKLPTWFDWAAEHAGEGNCVGMDYTQYPTF